VAAEDLQKIEQTVGTARQWGGPPARLLSGGALYAPAVNRLWRPSMIVLHQFRRTWGLLNASPFCVKLEAWLRLADLPYRIEPLHDPADAPKGKGPFIEDGGRRIGDSALIIEHLRQSRGVDPDAGLTPAERGLGRAVGLMLEEHLYFAMLHGRWVEDAGWPLVRDSFLGDLPAAAQDVVRRHVRDRIVAQGMGVHSREEIHALGVADIAALAAILGERAFLLGERPRTADCATFGFVHNLLCPRFDTPLRRAAEGHANLVAYERRMRERLFPDFRPA
jgi:glutathione S-transferase